MIRFFLRFYATIAASHVAAVLLWVSLAVLSVRSDMRAHFDGYFGGPSAWIARQLRESEDPERDAPLLGSEIGWPVSIRPSSGLHPGEELVFDVEWPSWTGLRAVDGRHLVAIGPFRVLPGGAPLRWFGLATFAFGGVALGLFLQLRPLERDLTKLEGVARRIARGELAARAELSGQGPTADLARSLDRMAESLQRQIETQRETLRGISHELRTPLARLRFSVEEIAVHGDEASRLRESERAVEDIEQLDALIGELLDYLKFEAAPDTHARCDAAAEIVKVISEEDGRASRVRVLAAGELPAVSARIDGRLLRRAVRNLVTNAIRHARTRVEIGLSLQDGSLSVLVDDDGPGIAPEERERLMLPFVRGELGRRLDPAGTGLGLAISQRIAEGHGGKLLLEESPAGGLRARLVLSPQ